MSTKKQILPREHLHHAPCWWRVADDGDTWRCTECEGEFPATVVMGILTPDGKFRILCEECVDTNWLRMARKMKGKL